ncbi:MAG: NAD(P)-dependent oxidoreductase [Firmicutes bacterium]|nr:NAD(P)-dependent oxidoreductase [Bacillota bacterium]
MKKKKMLLTGVNGFLCSRVAKYFEEKYHVIPLTRKELDITNHKEAERIIKENNPNIIFHAAAMSATLPCENNPELAHKVNLDAALNIARVAKETKAKMLFLSSEQVFNGNTNEGPYGEDDKAVPSTVYGETKLKAEGLLRKELKELWILRLSWMFGLPEKNVPNNPNLLWKSLKAVLTNQPIKISTNEYRGITYVYDLIENLEKIFDLPYGTYHFGSVNEESTYDTTVYILNKIGISKEIIDRVICRDDEKHRDQKRDLRMDYNKIISKGINIRTSQESIDRAIKEFDFKL